MRLLKTAHTRVGDHAKLDRRVTRLREMAYQAIKDSILHGMFGFAAPLVEERLAAELEISRTPVREALAILEHEGLIESIPYKGLFVKATTVAEFAVLHEAATTLTAILVQQAAPRICAHDRLLDLAEPLHTAAADLPAHVVDYLAVRRMALARLGDSANNPTLTTTLLGMTEHADLYLMNAQRVQVTALLRADLADLHALLMVGDAGAADMVVAKAQQLISKVRARLETSVL